MRKIVAVLVACSFFVACSAYTPVPSTQVAPASSMRLTLTDASHSETFGSIGSQVLAVEGTIRSVTDSALVMSVTEVARTQTDAEPFHGETVVIPRQSIASIDRRQTSVARSLLLTGLVAGAAIWIGIQGHGSVNQIRTKGSSPKQ